VPARVLALAGASLLLGTLAHVSGSTLSRPDPGPAAVTAALLVMLVTLVLGSGRTVARRLRRRDWSSHVEDAAALTALVLGQALVHGALGSPGAHRTAAASVHHHASVSETALAPGQSLAGHAGVGMAAAHAVAAIVAGLLLRSLERAVLALMALLAACARAACCALAIPVAPLICPASEAREPGMGFGMADVRPRLRAGFGPVVRRGPPIALV
jgi:hypothetical protein